MYRPRIIPCLLLEDQGLVKTIQFDQPTYVGDPINAVKIFNDARSDEVVFLDIRATKKGQAPNVDLIRKIGDEAFMPFAVGGGIRRMDDIHAIIQAGAEKIVLNSVCYTNPGLIAEAAAIYGSQAVVCSIDVKHDENGHIQLYSHGGSQLEAINVNAHLEEIIRQGAGELFVNSIDRDGTMSGYDEDVIKAVCDLVDIPVIACGGASDLDDFVSMIEHTGASAAAAGALFVFIGSKRAVLINYPEPDELFDLFESYAKDL